MNNNLFEEGTLQSTCESDETVSDVQSHEESVNLCVTNVIERFRIYADRKDKLGIHFKCEVELSDYSCAYNLSEDEFIAQYKQALCEKAEQLIYRANSLTVKDLCETMRGDVPLLDGIVLKHYRPERTLRQVQAWSDVHPSVVKKILKRHNLVCATPSKSGGLSAKNMLNLQSKGYSFEEIGELIDYPVRAVVHWFINREHYIKYREFRKQQK